MTQEQKFNVIKNTDFSQPFEVCSFLIEKGIVKQHDSKGLRIEEQREYLKSINKLHGLTIDNLITLSKLDQITAIVIEFFGDIEPNSVEIEAYVTTGSVANSVYGVYEWVNHPCSINLGKANWDSLKSKLTKLSLDLSLCNS